MVFRQPAHLQSACKFVQNIENQTNLPQSVKTFDKLVETKHYC